MDSEDEYIDAEEDSEEELDDDLRQAYDFQQNFSHAYLNSTSEEPSTSRQGFEEPPARTSLTIPLFITPVIVLPGQTIPLTASGIPTGILSEALEEKYPYIGILTIDFARGFDSIINIGVLVQVHNVTYLEEGFRIIGEGRQRFQLDRAIRETDVETGTLQCALVYIPRVKVEVLDDIVLPLFEYDPSCSLNRLRGKKKQYHLRSFYAISPAILENSSMEHIVKIIKKWLCLFIDGQKVDNALERGLPRFSFWVAANIPISSKEKLQILMENSVDRRLNMELQFISQLFTLGCKSCGSEKFKVEHLINLSSEAMANCFVNPSGYVHEMFTSSHIKNISYSGHAQTEYSWFPGYSWTIINCLSCGNHIGWMFKSNNLKPAKFFGVNRNAIEPIRRPVEI